MTAHLPECPAVAGWNCICIELRACEQRVLDTIRRDSWYEDGYNAALDAARDAVAALHVTRICPPGTKAALAAIDALRGDR